MTGEVISIKSARHGSDRNSILRCGGCGNRWFFTAVVATRSGKVVDTADLFVCSECKREVDVTGLHT